jgi:hypothetical protein
MRDITTTARRIARTVNASYGQAHRIYFNAGGYEVTRRIGPGEFGPNGSAYVYVIAPTLMGPQPQHWTWRMVQDAMDEQDQDQREEEE